MAKVAGPKLSGKSAELKVGGVDVEFGKWSANEEFDEESFGTSHTNGTKETFSGNGILKGSVEGKRRTDGEKIEAVARGGQFYALKLHFDANTYINVPSAHVNNLAFECDPATGVVQSYSFAFTSNGDWDYV